MHAHAWARADDRSSVRPLTAAFPMPSMPESSQPGTLPLDTRIVGHLPRVVTPLTRGAGALSAGAYLLFLVAMLFGAATSNPLLTPAAIAVLLLLVRLLRRPGETPVLLFAVGMQWLQVVAKILEADYEGVAVNELGHSVMMTSAIWLGLAGVAVLAIGMHVALRTVKPPQSRVVDAGLRSLSLDRLFAVYVAMLVIGLTAERLAWVLPAVGEILHAVGELRWAFYFLLGFAALRLRRRTTYFLIATAIEFLLGIGYFSSFKTVLFMAIIAALASGRRPNLRSFTVTAVAASAALFFALAWQAVKDDYRRYLNQGMHQQVVLVSPEEQVATFTTLMGGVNSQELEGSVQSLLNRLSYVDLFADVLDNVPARLPHEHGVLLWKAILHVLTPRILFPNKPVLASDSEETMYFTGRVLASDAQGTSISLGYMVEQYIDFGRFGMFVSIFLIGVCWGAMQRYCLSRPTAAAFDIAFASALMLFVDQFEMAEIKLVGGMLMRFIVFALFMRYALPALVGWVQASRLSPEAAR